MKFTETQTHKVKLHHVDLGQLGEAQLSFGGESGVVAMMSLLSAGPRLATDQTLDLLSATTEDGKEFTLCECRVHGSTLIAKCIVQGSILETRFNQFDVRYSDISEWFLGPERIEGSVGEQLTWTRRSEHFSADLTTDVRRFTLSSQCVSNSDRVGEDLILHEHVEFSFKSSDDGFSLQEVRDEATGLCALLSLITAYPISIVGVQRYTKEGRAQSLYFGTFQPMNRDTTRDFSIQCLLQKSLLDGRWPSILQNYYQDRGRRDTWVRMAGMQRYEGFWDFGLLGYVSLLDRYVKQRATGCPVELSQQTQKKINELVSELSQFTPALGADTITAVRALAQRIFGNQGPSFAAQYVYVMKQTDAEVLAVINLTDADFSLIKKVRDRIAHGGSPDVSDGDFSKVQMIISKIELLLTYWALHDLGIHNKEFLSAMNATHNRMYLKASVDRKSLARATETAAFYSVSAEKFAQLTSHSDLRFYACFIEGPTGEIEFAAHYTARKKAWLTNPTPRGGAFSWADVLDVETAAIKYHGTVYIESGENSLQLSAACILDKSKLPPSSDA